ncbi:AlpA family transcriptional regulator [Acinetobacter sp. VNH17]|uniref:AlpA family transcriptional regulator n=1 Tax=Acinetobacter thutiue TaxID=2998078 RepID=A0ABT7WJT4_9GAMM|nr:AlpA family transcriptional regulator [Acinetobacter thutiue]MCY6410727.1 AlpA family transcriptional regulator [Acinetobacter thutiue]MDN0012829.1 AlpA family transcriptional regulator [Acinetobacter thutiue]
MTNLVEYQYRILNIKAVIEITALSRSTIYELMNPKSKYYDVSFPKPIRLTEVRVGWVSQEIDEWIESKIAQRQEEH